MARFNFTTRDGADGVEEDRCDLPDVATARETAVVFAGDVMRGLGGKIYDEGLHVVVTDDAGRLCWDLKVSAVEGPGAFVERR